MDAPLRARAGMARVFRTLGPPDLRQCLLGATETTSKRARQSCRTGVLAPQCFNVQHTSHLSDCPLSRWDGLRSRVAPLAFTNVTCLVRVRCTHTETSGSLHVNLHWRVGQGVATDSVLCVESLTSAVHECRGYRWRWKGKGRVPPSPHRPQSTVCLHRPATSARSVHMQQVQWQSTTGPLTMTERKRTGRHAGASVGPTTSNADSIGTHPTLSRNGLDTVPLCATKNE